jgi:hypothetical protein
MGILDNALGSGAEAEFFAAYRFDDWTHEIEYEEIKGSSIDGRHSGVVQNVRWTKPDGTYAGSFTVRIFPGEYVEPALWLNNEEAQREGLLTLLASKLPGIFRSHGTTVMRVAAVTSDGDAALRSIGFVDNEEGGLIAQFEEANNNRLDEYSQWKAGNRQRPDWHAALGT